MFYFAHRNIVAYLETYLIEIVGTTQLVHSRSIGGVVLVLYFWNYADISKYFIV